MQRVLSSKRQAVRRPRRRPPARWERMLLLSLSPVWRESLSDIHGASLVDHTMLRCRVRKTERGRRGEPSELESNDEDDGDAAFSECGSTRRFQGESHVSSLMLAHAQPKNIQAETDQAHRGNEADDDEAYKLARSLAVASPPRLSMDDGDLSRLHLSADVERKNCAS